ncbi:Coenzyme F420 hydrogenase/dehydrogenase, beta subunit C-terminal domain [uncultured Alistipes sp.]|jgi:coenzyme F420-reducing hydrogenase beta subunit|uniref:Coenzyme F420 hydrogenase/dehydrogenase, beta subunit C-terminal domain n=1 Tax=uncultured Alistipes sp. TaxID=538949 RepID=UPI0025E19A5E|nr:Coenzyme F420 hydrogenase/dehydrogenase, beta subunit C-terminal domain [uncultured Alistipes sp.]
MISIDKKQNCCGCEACIQRCPKSCIQMQQDTEGFLYPVVDTESCIDCGICEKICPILNQSNEKKPLTVYAAKCKDESLRLESSSGGIFTLLANEIIRENGVVFGAKFNSKWEVIHDYATTAEELAQFRGSKYVQSKIGQSYQQVLHFLKGGGNVLFSGTPCQIAGLKLFLQKDYENLITVDFICHGVPSPEVWRLYLNDILHKRQSIPENIRFRDKRSGWKKYSLSISFKKMNTCTKKLTFAQSVYENLYLRGFLANLYLRPSCHHCPSKSFKSNSDITIADFWGIESLLPNWNDDRGVSLVMLNSPLGERIFGNINTTHQECEYREIIPLNPAIVHSAPAHIYRTDFFHDLNTHKYSISSLVLKYCFTPRERIKRIIKKWSGIK